MLIALGLTLGVIVIAMAVHRELRSALYGLALSNGVEVLVSPETYRVIVKRYMASGERDEENRWDQAILDILRVERPREWGFLVRSLGYHIAQERFGARRRRQAVTR